MASSSTFLATDGSGYEQTMGRWSRRLARPFLEFAGSGPGERVLDVGCGTGHLAAALGSVPGAGEVHGVDFSPAYIGHARTSHPESHFDFRVGDACALDYADASFDRVLAMLLLHFVTAPAKAVAEMRRVARPGGVVAATVWDVRGGYVANRMFFDTAAALDPKAGERRAKNYTRPMTRPGELEAAWRAAGLHDVAATVLSIRMEYTSFDDYWAPYLGHEGRPPSTSARSTRPGASDSARPCVPPTWTARPTGRAPMRPWPGP